MVGKYPKDHPPLAHTTPTSPRSKLRRRRSQVHPLQRLVGRIFHGVSPAPVDRPKRRPGGRKTVSSPTSKVIPLSSRRSLRKGAPAETSPGLSRRKRRGPKASNRKRSQSLGRPSRPSRRSPGSSTRSSRRPLTPSAAPRRLRRSPRKPPVSPVAAWFNRLPKAYVYALRLVILGVGLGTVMGTMLSINNSHLDEAIQVQTPGASSVMVNAPRVLARNQELSALDNTLTAIAANYPQLKAAFFFMDTDTGNYVAQNEEIPAPAASTIKLPLLLAFFQDVEQGKVFLDQPLVMEADLMVGEAGTMRQQAPGTEFTALETVTQMITNSDNTATNMIIKLLGGPTQLNQRFKTWGLTATELNNPLPDLGGTNTTSPRDLALVLEHINQGHQLSPKSRDRLFYILRHTQTNAFLAQGLTKETMIAHKTGDIASLLGDAGLIDLPNGKQYLGTILVQRPSNDGQAQALIQKMSQEVAQHFSQSTLPRVRGESTDMVNKPLLPNPPAQARKPSP